MAFSFEDLKVYKAAINWNDNINQILDDLAPAAVSIISSNIEWL
jgi:hypothetical protein